MSNPNKSRIKHLDGIRGWASFAVLLCHILMAFLALSTPFLLFNKARFLLDLHSHNYFDIFFGIALRFISDGRLAVLIFFILSGYALSISHLGCERNNLALSTTSRYFRLMLPIAFISLLTYLLLKFNLMLNLQVATTPERSSNWLGTFYAFEPNLTNTLRFATFDVFFQYDESLTLNPTLWTMPNEILGSFFIYAYIAIFNHQKKIRLKLISLIIILLFITNPLLACFPIGYAMAEFHRLNIRQNAIKHYGEAGINYFFILIFIASAILSTYFRGSDHLVCIFAVCIILSISYSSTLRAFFENRFSQFLGRISFPLYLIQLPIICSYSSYIYLKLPSLGFDIVTSNLINLFSTIILSLFVATLILPVDRLCISYSKKIGMFILNKI